MGIGENRRHSLPSSNEGSELECRSNETAMKSLPIQPAFNFDPPLAQSSTPSNQREKSPEIFALQTQATLNDDLDVSGITNSSNISNENGCAIAVQLEDDLEEEENEDEISETVALTQKYDKSRLKKN